PTSLYAQPPTPQPVAVAAPPAAAPAAPAPVAAAATPAAPVQKFAQNTAPAPPLASSASPPVKVRFYSLHRDYGDAPDPIAMPKDRPLVLVGPADDAAAKSGDDQARAKAAAQSDLDPSEIF
ncbi:MAG: hypothetical protein ACHP7N_19770, partial [Caulobacterales bacterium]